VAITTPEKIMNVNTVVLCGTVLATENNRQDNILAMLIKTANGDFPVRIVLRKDSKLEVSKNDLVSISGRLAVGPCGIHIQCLEMGIDVSRQKRSNTEQPAAKVPAPVRDKRTVTEDRKDF
jgi:hypothetical protein